MAVAAIIPAMRPVHPFFEQSQRLQNIPSQANARPKRDSAEKSRQHDALPPPADEDGKEDGQDLVEHGRRSTRRRNKATLSVTSGPGSAKQSADLSTEGADTVIKPLEAAAVQDVARESLDDKRVTVGEAYKADPDVHRRKRRRITPLTQEKSESLPASKNTSNDKLASKPGLESSSWLEQLQLHAGCAELQSEGTKIAKQSSLAGSPSVHPTADASIALESSSRLNSESARGAYSKPGKLHVPSGLRSLTPTFKKVIPREMEVRRGDNMTNGVNGQENKAEQSPKRKMLRLNQAGRFSSPVPKQQEASTFGSELKRRSARSRKTLCQPAQLLVVIKYGTNSESQSRIGRRIEDICVGSNCTPSVGTNVSNPTPILSKPSKPTHPFFLAKPTLDSDGKHEQNTDSLSQDTPNLPAKLPSPRKSAVTPGKLRCEAYRTSRSQLEADYESPNSAKPQRGLGGNEAPWPTADNLHVRGPGHEVTHSPTWQRNSDHLPSSDHRKLKGSIVSVEDKEDLLSSNCRKLSMRIRSVADRRGFSRPTREALRLPQRLVTCGPELQEMIRKEVRASLPASSLYSTSASPSDVGPSTSQSQAGPQSAIHKLYQGISNNMTAFDRGQCENQSWAQKYAPKSAADVLQIGKEITILRNWLKGLKVSLVEGASVDVGPKGLATATKRLDSGKNRTEKRPKKRRKRHAELDDFILSSDEEADGLEEVADGYDNASDNGLNGNIVKSVVRLGNLDLEAGTGVGKKTNTVLLSGPCGCGKSAAVYAVAKELGFEIFEINSSSRRSGKDVLDRVGDMTRNHLVHKEKPDSTQTAAADDLERMEAAFEKDLSSGRQGTMNSFFQPASKNKTKLAMEKPSPKLPKDLKEKHASKQQSQQQQKQSLVLLEEVDILFEEDKQFWMTVISLCSTSKRPIIMTCNDESLVPLGALELHAILRFSPPPVDLATDYLLLMAANEGHILTRDAVSALFNARGYDLRASIAELDFWCQMGVGAEKGGWDWMTERWPPGIDTNDKGHTVRVASKDTYQRAMGWLGRDYTIDPTVNGGEKAEELLLEAWREWGVDTREWHYSKSEAATAPDTKVTYEERRESNMRALRRLEQFSEACSAVDVFAKVGLPIGNKDFIDPAQPAATEKARLSYIEGFPLLKAIPLADYAEFDTRIAVATRLCGEHVLRPRSHYEESLRQDCDTLSTIEDMIVAKITERHNAEHHSPQLSRSDFSTAFDPISEPSITAPSMSSYSGFHMSSFDRPFSIIVTDLAPYVRSVVSYDLELEERRVKLSSLLSQHGRDGKKARTTRASRSALEGGKRETTRRERWFGKDLNAALVLKTGGEHWPATGRGAILQACSISTEDVSSRRSSVGSADELGMEKP